MADYTVRARWDEATRTWWTDGEDIPGLTLQADTFDELYAAILDLAPELLRANGAAAGAAPPDRAFELSVVAERHATCTAG